VFWLQGLSSSGLRLLVVLPSLGNMGVTIPACGGESGLEECMKEVSRAWIEVQVLVITCIMLRWFILWNSPNCWGSWEMRCIWVLTCPSLVTKRHNWGSWQFSPPWFYTRHSNDPTVSSCSSCNIGTEILLTITNLWQNSGINLQAQGIEITMMWLAGDEMAPHVA
jgi:hypothetical protein